jgi:arsenite methyltransferase
MEDHRVPMVDRDRLREAIQAEYRDVATMPEKGFHFHTGRPLATMLGYNPDEIDSVPLPILASFAGTGNPFQLGKLEPGARVVDVGCGTGFDSLIAAQQVGSTGYVRGMDMTAAMLDKARAGAHSMGLSNIEFCEGYAEDLPVPDEWADVAISNGVLNLVPDKLAALREVFRVLRPGGRLQIGDILVQQGVPESAKGDIALWTG